MPIETLWSAMMATGKRRRKPAGKKSGIGMGWWLAGLLGVGWIVHGSNPALMNGVYDKVATLAGMTDQKTQPTRTASAPRATTAKPATTSPRPAAPTPERKAQVASIANPATPATRPAAASRPVLKSGQLRLLSEPKDGSTVRATVEPGKVLRIVESKGEWRRVEAGIFTGWVRAASLGRNASAAMPTAMRPPSMQVERADRRIVPPASVNGQN
ncbi:SH3 domain-containing protein [Aureimonas altamirensis]|uniref:SH3 domain-containing protein n=2 Tax=Aureimonas altamirensis TaxID=370622 RepID=UPI003017B184